MEILLPEKSADSGGIDGFNDYYYFPSNISADYYPLDPIELCKITKPANPTAQGLSVAMAILGILFNCCVICVMTVLKEYKKSRFYWFFLHIMLSNILFLWFVFIQMVNELEESWVMDAGLCKINEGSMFSSHGAGVVFLTIANICGIIAHMKPINCPLPSLPWSPPELLKSIVILFLVWFPCVMVNLPLYRHTKINDCGQCAQQFPVDVYEICPMLGLNETGCADLVKFILDDVTYDGTAMDDVRATFSGDLGSGKMFDYAETYEDRDRQLLDNLTAMAGMTACRYEEPKSFFVWLFATFGLFFATPIPIFLIFVAVWMYGLVKKEKKVTTINNKNQESAFGMIVALDMLFLLCWTPWNAVHMKKAFGGVQGDSGHQCAALINYSRLSAITYNALMPFIYIGLTSRFRARLLTSLVTVFHFCLRSTTATRRERAGTSESNEIKTMTSVCDVEEKENGNAEENHTVLKLNQMESLPSTDV